MVLSRAAESKVVDRTTGSGRALERTCCCGSSGSGGRPGQRKLDGVLGDLISSPDLGTKRKFIVGAYRRTRKEQFEEGPITQVDIYQTELYPCLMGLGLNEGRGWLIRGYFAAVPLEYVGTTIYNEGKRGIVEFCRSRREAECSSTRRSQWVVYAWAASNLVDGASRQESTSSSRWRVLYLGGGKKADSDQRRSLRGQ